MLSVILQVAIPLRMAELHAMSPTERRRIIRMWAADAADVVAVRGDQLMYRTKPTKGEGGTADTFNHLARGLAALAYCPGGVLFTGRHWCVEHPGGLAATSVAELACTRGDDPDEEPEVRLRRVFTVHPAGEVL